MRDFPAKINPHSRARNPKSKGMAQGKIPRKAGNFVFPAGSFWALMRSRSQAGEKRDELGRDAAAFPKDCQGLGVGASPGLPSAEAPQKQHSGGSGSSQQSPSSFPARSCRTHLEPPEHRGLSLFHPHSSGSPPHTDPFPTDHPAFICHIPGAAALSPAHPALSQAAAQLKFLPFCGIKAPSRYYSRSDAPAFPALLCSPAPAGNAGWDAAIPPFPATRLLPLSRRPPLIGAFPRKAGSLACAPCPSRCPPERAEQLPAPTSCHIPAPAPSLLHSPTFPEQIPDRSNGNWVGSQLKALILVITIILISVGIKPQMKERELHFPGFFHVLFSSPSGSRISPPHPNFSSIPEFSN